MPYQDPPLTREQLVEMFNYHKREHARAVEMYADQQLSCYDERAFQASQMMDAISAQIDALDEAEAA